MKSLSKKLIGGTIFFLSCIAFLSFVWPCCRAFLPIMVNTNEGWNAFFADAAMGKMPLYPSLDKLITNNYPPLSFYVVGSFGKICGDPIFAGRILSLLAIIVIAFFIGKIVRQFGGSLDFFRNSTSDANCGVAPVLASSSINYTLSRCAPEAPDTSSPEASFGRSLLQPAVVGSAYFIGTMCLSFRWYVGVNDPQLLAQAIMIVGFFLFLRSMERDANYWLPLLIMVMAGFFKHNIITLPCSAMLGLVLWRRWSTLKFSLLFSGVLVAIGLACCYGCYGANFFHNFLTPRSWMPEKTMDALGDLHSLLIGIFLWLLIAWRKRQQKSVQLITLMMILALLVGFVQRLGSGVFVNAQFDLVMTISIAMGVGFQFLASAKKEWQQFLWLLFLVAPFLVSPNLYSFTQIFSSSGRAAIAQEEQEMNQLVEEVKISPVDVFCESYITYRAGKPFVIDAFNVEERINAKKLPADVVERLIEQGKLVEVKREWLVGEE